MSAAPDVTSIFPLEWVVVEVARCGAADLELEMVEQLGKCPHFVLISELVDVLRGAVIVPVVTLVISCMLDIVGGFNVVSLVGSFVEKDKEYYM